MKRIVCILLACALSVALLTLSVGCNSNREATDSIKVVCTVFPVYDWVSNLMDPNGAESIYDIEQGEPTAVELVLLCNNGADVHSYQPTASDIVDISTCDLLIYVGGESDKWIADAVKNSTNPNQKVICLMDELKEELIKEDHDHEDEHLHLEHDHSQSYDEHVWLSLKNAALFCKRIAAVIKEIDPDNQVLYSLNEESYIAKLDALDRYTESLVETSSKKALIFADRFPFAYMMKDYGIEYYAAFEGCSAETSASFDTIISLAAKVDELGIKVIFTTEKTDGNVADAVIVASNSSGLKVRPLNSMQSVSLAEIRQGVTYLSLMEDNIVFLKEALD